MAPESPMASNTKSAPPPVSAQDYGRTAPLHQCHAGLTNTLKHVRGGMTVEDLEEVELAYAPPYGSAKDPVNMAGFVGGNVRVGDVRMTEADALPADACLLDDADHIEDILVGFGDLFRDRRPRRGAAGTLRGRQAPLHRGQVPGRSDRLCHRGRDRAAT